jgi:hypothetical protein
MAAAELLEKGDLYFLYTPRVRPRLEEPFETDESVAGPRDVQRLHVVLSPHGKPVYRRLLVGRKRMPETRRQRFWAEIERVCETPAEVCEDLGRYEYETKTRGSRVQPPSRPAGEGIYALARHGDHAHLAYRLEVPRRPGEVQRALRILPEASYIVAAFNPEAPPKLGRRAPDVGPVPRWMQAKFHGRKFAPLDSDLLDVAGLELVLIGSSDDVEAELGIHLEAKSERLDLLRDLHLDPREHPLAPALDGSWT